MTTKVTMEMVGWLCLITGFGIAICAASQEATGTGGPQTMETKFVETNIADVEHLIKALDTKYQLAVKNNDAATMESILADDFVLVTGRGKVYTKADLLTEARRRTTTYERQESRQQTVRVWGDTAVITAQLWEKGMSGGQTFDKVLWFSDVYKLTPAGWKYVFAQSSIPLPPEK